MAAMEKSSCRPTAWAGPAVYSTVELQVRSSFSPAFTCPPSVTREKPMNLSVSIGPIVALIAGILILLIPRLLNYIVAVYLIVIGLIGLFGHGSLRL
jgi:hypothetical protein